MDAKKASMSMCMIQRCSEAKDRSPEKLAAKYEIIVTEGPVSRIVLDKGGGSL